MDTDDDLMARALSGDTAAFAALVHQHQNRLLRFAFRIVGDWDNASDIVQDSFIRLWKSRNRYRQTGSAQAYLLTIVRSVCLDNLRTNSGLVHRQSDNDLPYNGVNCELAAMAGNFDEAVQEALLELPQTQREIFILSEYEGMTYQEIAAIVGCPHGTVASRKHAAIEKLRQSLRHWVKGETHE